MPVLPQKAMRSAKKQMLGGPQKRIIAKQLWTMITRLKTGQLVILVLAAGVVVAVSTALRPLPMFLLDANLAVIVLGLSWREAKYQLLDESYSLATKHPVFSVEFLWNAAADPNSGDFTPYYSIFRGQQDPIQAFYLKALFKDFCGLPHVGLHDARHVLVEYFVPLTAALNWLYLSGEVKVSSMTGGELKIFQLHPDSNYYVEQQTALQAMQNDLYIWLKPYYERLYSQTESFALISSS